MPPCKNSTGYYTGKEPSPKGFGYCAHSSVVGRRLIGKDGDVWIVRQDKNGRLAWKKYMKTPDDYWTKGGTPKSRRTPGTPKCRPDQIVNPRTNRCVSKHGKIGQELLSRNETVQRGNSRSTGQQKFAFLAEYPRSNTAYRLTATEMKLAKKQFGITILGYQINQDGTLDGYGYAESRLHVRDWLQRINAWPILELKRI